MTTEPYGDTIYTGSLISSGASQIDTIDIFAPEEYSLSLGANAGASISTGVRNTFVGYNAGRKVTTGTDNVAIGRGTMDGGETYNVTGGYNLAIGTYAMRGSASPGLSGSLNVALGDYALYQCTSGYHNMAIGSRALYAIKGGYANIAIGYYAGQTNITGGYNVYIGRTAGQNHTGSRSIIIGAYAGMDETGSQTLMVDCYDRTSEALGRAGAILYGQMNSTPSSQVLTINATVLISHMPSGATQAAAGASAGELWSTSGHASLPDNVVMIGV